MPAPEPDWAGVARAITRFDPKDPAADTSDLLRIRESLESADRVPAVAVSALDDLLKRWGKIRWWAHGRVATTLWKVDGPTRERGDILIRAFDIGLDPRAGEWMLLPPFARLL